MGVDEYVGSVLGDTEADVDAVSEAVTEAVLDAVSLAVTEAVMDAVVDAEWQQTHFWSFQSRQFRESNLRLVLSYEAVAEHQARLSISCQCTCLHPDGVQCIFIVRSNSGLSAHLKKHKIAKYKHSKFAISNGCIFCGFVAVAKFL